VGKRLFVPDKWLCQPRQLDHVAMLAVLKSLYFCQGTATIAGAQYLLFGNSA
jgi:hypothetical protein